MLKSVSIVNERGDRLDLPLNDPYPTGLAIRNIEGIGAGTSSINTTNLVTVDGSVYNSAHRDERNIVFEFIFLPAPMVEDTRHLTYQFFRVKSEVQLIFKTDTRTVFINGYVESNEPAIFTDDDKGWEIATISIICPFPYFELVYGGSTTMFNGIEAMFEFPWSNESLVERLLIMSELVYLYEREIIYEGDSDTGFYINIHFLADSEEVGSYLRIYNLDTKEYLEIQFDKIEKIVGSPITKGDDLMISTVQGEKGIFYTHEGQTYNVLNALDRNAKWFQLKKGSNRFAFVLDVDDYLNKIRFSITHSMYYEGV